MYEEIIELERLTGVIGTDGHIWFIQIGLSFGQIGLSYLDMWACLSISEGVNINLFELATLISILSPPTPSFHIVRKQKVNLFLFVCDFSPLTTVRLQVTHWSLRKIKKDFEIHGWWKSAEKLAFTCVPVMLIGT